MKKPLRKAKRILKRVVNANRYERRLRKAERYRVLAERHEQRFQEVAKHRKDAARVGVWRKFVDAQVSRAALTPMQALPMQDNKILAMAYQSKQFACNPKYITEYLRTQFPGEFDITWAFRDSHRFEWLKEWGYNVVEMYSREYLYAAATSRTVIYNMRMPVALKFRPEQLTIGTGHGGGAYKKLLLDNPQLRRVERWEITQAATNTRLYLSSCTAYTEHVIRGAFGHTGEVLESGMARNDMLVNGTYDEAVQRVRRHYRIPDGVRILLYAPTYRKGTRVPSDYGINMTSVLQAAKQRFGGDWVAMIRMHYFIQTPLDTPSGYHYIDVSDYWDMQELLAAADVLITDYSSSVWDYSLLRRPGFLLATDLEKYQDDQGFYTPIEEWPFRLSQSNDELLAAIEAFDEDDNAARCKGHHEALGSKEDGHATERIVERIRQEVRTSAT